MMLKSVYFSRKMKSEKKKKAERNVKSKFYCFIFKHKNHSTWWYYLVYVEDLNQNTGDNKSSKPYRVRESFDDSF